MSCHTLCSVFRSCGNTQKCGKSLQSLTCKARLTDTSIAVNEVDACGVVQAGWRHALIYVDLTVFPCKRHDILKKGQSSQMALVAAYCTDHFHAAAIFLWHHTQGGKLRMLGQHHVTVFLCVVSCAKGKEPDKLISFQHFLIDQEQRRSDGWWKSGHVNEHDEPIN